MNGKTTSLLVAVMLVLGLATTATAQSNDTAVVLAQTDSFLQVDFTVPPEIDFGVLTPGDHPADAGNVTITTNGTWRLEAVGGPITLQRNIGTADAPDWRRVCDDGSGTFPNVGDSGCQFSGDVDANVIPPLRTRMSATANGTTAVLPDDTTSWAALDSGGSGENQVRSLTVGLTTEFNDPISTAMDGTVRWRSAPTGDSGDDGSTPNTEPGNPVTFRVVAG